MRGVLTSLVGLLLFILLCFLCSNKHGPEIEEELTLNTRQALDQANFQFAIVEFDGRDLTLTGAAPDIESKAKAEEVAWDKQSSWIERGVRTIDNQITVAELIENDLTPVEPSSVIQEPVTETQEQSYETSISFNAGKILLQGHVADEAERSWLVNLAQKEYGVDVVTDQLIVTEGVPQDRQAVLELILTNLAALEQGQATLRNSILVMSGDTTSELIVTQVTNQVTQGLGQNHQAAFELSVIEPTMAESISLDSEPAVRFRAIPNPYQTVINYENGRINMSGHVADGAAVQHMVSLASEIVGKDNVSHQLDATYGSPQGWNNAIGAVLSNIQMLENATVTLVNSDISLIGHAASDKIRKQIKAAVENGLSEFSASFGITAPESDPANSCRQKIRELIQGQSILFAWDKADLDDNGRALLDDLAVGMTECPSVTIDIHGHTDYRGSYAHNFELSEKRAKAAMIYLINAGVSADRLNIRGFSESEPVIGNETKEGMSKNRRIEFKVRGG